MKIVNVNTGKPYRVVIGDGVRRAIGKTLLELAGKSDVKVAVITDTTVEKLFLDDVVAALKSSGIECVVYTFAPGENSKTLETFGKIVEFLAANHLTRSDFVVALGGGIPGDVAGFAASAFLRGVRFVQVPTTLLAAVDSSVGGKTAVNLGAGKNLCGAFYQPVAVLCDPETLKTLPKPEFACGAAEVVKYGMIFDPELFAALENGALTTDVAAVIARSVEIKAGFVAEDEFDRGRRQLLNFGHTWGHAVEKCSDFSIRHGEAVAIGMVKMTTIAAKKGFCAPDLPERLVKLLEKLHLPAATDIPDAQLLEALLSDKKRSGNKINLVLPRKLGECFLHTVDVGEIANFLK